MTTVRLRTTLSGSPAETFRRFESVSALSEIKKELRLARIARSEAGLEIVDARLRLPFFLRPAARLTYSTIPGASAELKQIRGPMAEYRWTYSFSEIGGITRLDAEAVVRPPLGPLGFLLALIFAPGAKRMLRRELKLLERLSATRQ